MYLKMHLTCVEYALSFGVAKASSIEEMSSVHLFFVIHRHSFNQQQVLCHQTRKKHVITMFNLVTFVVHNSSITNQTLGRYYYC